MTDLLIKPKKLKGSVHIPPSKSMAHRAIISAALAGGQSVIKNIQLSDDIKATISGMESFGAEIKIVNQGDRSQLTIQGSKGKLTSEKRTIDANESGSTLRFLIPIASLYDGETSFIGRGKLGVRPLDTYEKIFHDQGLRFEPSGTGKLDLKVQGNLKAGTYEMEGNVSSQFITGLLFTLPLLDEDSIIQITTELESVGYLDLTLEVLESFGIEIDFNEEKRQFIIKGNQSYQAKNYTVEGDYSQAAFFLSAGALGNDVSVRGLDENSKQGDREIIPILELLNSEVEISDGGVQASAKKLKSEQTVDGSQVPDIIPISALVAALSEGQTKITNLKRLRIKESDRLEATKRELEKLGAEIKVAGDDLHIQGTPKLKGDAVVWSHKDHRMAMMLAIASTVCENKIVIKDAECVEKSYPTFWKEFESLGGQISEWNMGK